VIAFAQRYSSLAAITAASTSPIFAYVVTGSLRLVLVTVLITAVLLYRHATNISRLIRGTEPKIGSEKKAS